mmetsp:Transcript_31788/g.109880  ORF Transcript_31788/g.109880 Transcript_31788/m.109880 type:complete len:179 (+) Transcript_31788:377-913(+)
MLPCPEALTTEHIKSHLQKYRLHYERSKEEFLGHYRKYLRVSSPDDESDCEPGSEPAADETPVFDDAAVAWQAPQPGEALFGVEELTKLSRAQNVQALLVQHQFELHNALQIQMHKQLQIQAEFAQLIRDASAPVVDEAPDDRRDRLAPRNRHASKERHASTEDRRHASGDPRRSSRH